MLETENEPVSWGIRKGDHGEEQIRKSQQRLSMALEAARAGAWEWEIGSDRTFWSPENYALMGLPAGSGFATYDDWLARVHPDDREWVQAEVAEAVEKRGDLDFEYRVVWPDGTLRWLRDIGKMMLDNGGAPIGMYGIQIDVTEQKLLEERLRRSQRMEAMGLVAGSVAHDFNNLLTVIAGYGERLRIDPSLDESLAPKVEQILIAAKRAASLTHQLLAFGRRQVLRAQALDLNRMIGEMEALLVRTLGENVRVTVRQAKDLGCVRADRGQIEQVLLNLVVNARDAMPTGGSLTLETFEIDGGESQGEGLPPLAPGRHVGIRIRDTGHGMDAPTLERIFDPFFSTKPAHKGTGLGLASVYGIIKQSGGQIRAESEPGRGTTFVIYLPRVEEKERAAGSAERKDGKESGDESILVVEDEPAIRELISTSLGSRGYSILTAASAEEALDMVGDRKVPIDLLVTDVVLTGLTGPALSDRLAEHYPGLKVLFMTGYGHDVLGHHAAVDDMEIIHKPFSLSELAHRVREVIDRPAAGQDASGGVPASDAV